MRLALALSLIGAVLVFFAIMLVTTGRACRLADCGPSLNDWLLWSGLGFLAAALVRFLCVLGRGTRDADKD